MIRKLWRTTPLRAVLRAASILISELACLCQFASAGEITPGDLVVYGVGNGSAALGTTAATVFLDEYTTSGVLVQSIPLPSTGTSRGVNTLTAVGNDSTEGIISRSQDGTTLLFTGYRKDAGGTNPASDVYTITHRVIGTITTAGTPDLTTNLILHSNGANSANTIRSAASINGTAGSHFWTSSSTSIDFGTEGFGTTGGSTLVGPLNGRQVNLADNKVFASVGPGTTHGGVVNYGTTPAAMVNPPSPVVTLSQTDAVNGFAFLDLNSGVAGADTLYLLSTVEGLLRKFTYNGSNWSTTGSVASNASNLTAQLTSGSVSLFLTSPGALSSITDSSGFGGTLTGTPTTLANAGANTAFRGIGMFDANAVPEPSTVVLCIGLYIVLTLRRTARG
jgi:hypothetical protein